MKRKTNMTDLAAHFVAKYKKAKLKTLIFEEKSDPFLAFGDFFSISDIEGHLQMLKKLFKYAVSNRSIKRHPADIILHYETFTKILNAAWVINETGVRFADLGSKEVYAGIRTGGSLSDEVLYKRLIEREILDPYFGIGNAFKKMSLDQYHHQLNDWYKLSLCSGDNIGDDRKPKKTYRNIIKVLICSWLIYDKEILSHQVLA